MDPGERITTTRRRLAGVTDCQAQTLACSRNSDGLHNVSPSVDVYITNWTSTNEHGIFPSIAASACECRIVRTMERTDLR